MLERGKEKYQSLHQKEKSRAQPRLILERSLLDQLLTDKILVEGKSQEEGLHVQVKMEPADREIIIFLLVKLMVSHAVMFKSVVQRIVTENVYLKKKKQFPKVSIKIHFSW